MSDEEKLARLRALLVDSAEPGRKGLAEVQSLLARDVPQRSVELASLYNQARYLVEGSLPWEAKYHLIFDDIAPKVRALLPFNYYDSDGDYEDDVSAWWNAFRENLGES